MSDQPWTQHEQSHARWVRRVRLLILVVPLVLTGIVLYRMQLPEPEEGSKLIWQRESHADLEQEIGKVFDRPPEETKEDKPWMPFFGTADPPSPPEPPPAPPPAPTPPPPRSWQAPRPEPVVTELRRDPAASVGTIKARFDIGKLDAESPAEPKQESDDAETNGLRLVAGTLLPAVLLQTANSDAPGLVQARLTQDVFDTLTGRHLAIPTGTLVIGQTVGLGAARQGVEMAWQQLVFPNGRTLDLEMSTLGRGGGPPTGKRQSHLLNKVGAVLLSASTAAALQVSQRPASTSQVRFYAPGQVATEEAARDASRVLDDWAEERLQRPPTVILPLGSEVLVQLLDDLNL